MLCSSQRDPFKHSQSFNRPNIEYSVRKKTAKTLIEDIPNIIKARIRLSGIIYCLSKRDTEKVCEVLQERLPELRNKVTFYHADVSPEQRESRQRAWCKGDIRVIVATIAFGMGINKPGEYDIVVLIVNIMEWHPRPTHSCLFSYQMCAM